MQVQGGPQPQACRGPRPRKQSRSRASARAALSMCGFNYTPELDYGTFAMALLQLFYHGLWFFCTKGLGKLIQNSLSA
eukprot:710144-Hanusia_phi.AAC.1